MVINYLDTKNLSKAKYAGLHRQPTLHRANVERADSRELVVIVLQQAGYEVDCTESPIEAIQSARDRVYDLILVDNWMRQMSCDQLTTEIRTFNVSTPMLYYSGAAYESDKQRARDAGAQGYLVKPEGISKLVTEVARLIAEARIAFPVAIDPPILDPSTKALLERLQFLFAKNKEVRKHAKLSSRHLSSTLKTNAACLNALRDSKRLVEFTPKR